MGKAVVTDLKKGLVDSLVLYSIMLSGFIQTNDRLYDSFRLLSIPVYIYIYTLKNICFSVVSIFVSIHKTRAFTIFYDGVNCFTKCPPHVPVDFMISFIYPLE